MHLFAHADQEPVRRIEEIEMPFICGHGRYVSGVKQKCFRPLVCCLGPAAGKMDQI